MLIDSYFLVGRGLDKYVYSCIQHKQTSIVNVHLYFFGHAYIHGSLAVQREKQLKISLPILTRRFVQQTLEGSILISFPLNFKARWFQSWKPEGPDEFHWINPCANAYAAPPPRHCQ